MLQDGGLQSAPVTFHRPIARRCLRQIVERALYTRAHFEPRKWRASLGIWGGSRLTKLCVYTHHERAPTCRPRHNTREREAQNTGCFSTLLLSAERFRGNHKKGHDTINFGGFSGRCACALRDEIYWLETTTRRERLNYSNEGYFYFYTAQQRREARLLWLYIIRIEESCALRSLKRRGGLFESRTKVRTRASGYTYFKIKGFFVLYTVWHTTNFLEWIAAICSTFNYCDGQLRYICRFEIEILFLL